MVSKQNELIKIIRKNDFKLLILTAQFVSFSEFLHSFDLMLSLVVEALNFALSLINHQLINEDSQARMLQISVLKCYTLMSQ